MEKAKKILQLITLLLLLTVVGATTVWGQTLYYQDFENNSDISEITSNKKKTLDKWFFYASTPTLVTGDPNYGNYLNMFHGNGSGHRSEHTTFFENGKDFYGGLTEYTIEFDAAITPSSPANTSYTQNDLVLYGDGQGMPNGNAQYDGTNHILRIYGGGNNSTTYTVEGSNSSITIDNNAWYHYKIKVNRSTRQVNYSIGNSISGSYTLSNDVSTNIQGIEVGLGRQSSNVRIDNIHVYGLFTYYLVSDNPTWTLIKEGLAAEGSSATAYYPQYELRGTTLYEAAANNSQYSKTFTVTQNYQQETVPYTTNTISNVVFYSEGENIEGASIGTDLARASNGYLGHTGGIDNFVDVKLLAPGTYTLHYTANNNNSADRNCIFRIGNYDLFNHTIEGNTRWQYHKKDFTVSESSMLSFAFNGHNGSGVDWVYITATGLAFQEASGTYVKGTSNQKPTLINTTGETATFTSSNTNIVEVSSDGTLTLKDYGQAVITATAGGSTTTHKVTVVPATDATFSFTYDENTHIETFSITSSGNIANHFEGERIVFDVGNPDELQYVESQGGLCCIDANGYSFAHLHDNATYPDMGTYYAFTPKYSGMLTITGAINGENPIRLTDAAGTVLETVTFAVGTNQIRTFNTKLQAGQTYYVYVKTGAMTTQSGDGTVTDARPTLYLKSFSFDATQVGFMTINVSDLLYATVDGGINSTGNKLDRTIPCFDLTFSGGDGATSYNSNSITFYQNASGHGQLVITPRLLTSGTNTDFRINSITLNYDAIESGKATSILVNNQTVPMAEGSTQATVNVATFDPVTILYNQDDDYSFVLTSLTLNYEVTSQASLDEVLDLSKTATKIAFENSEFAVASGHPKTHSAIFATPIAPQAYSYGGGFTAPVTYSSGDTSIATVDASTGEVTMLATTLGTETTITANFAGTDYFLPSSGTYKVKSSVDANGFTIEHVRRGMVVEVDMSSDGAAEFNFTNTIANSQQINSAEETVISTYAFDNGGNNDEFNVEITVTPGTASAYIHAARAYYRKPALKLSYPLQAVYNHHPNWTDATLTSHFANNQGVGTCFDLEGEPTFTAYFEGTDLAKDFVIANTATYTVASGNIMLVTDPSTTPKGTLRSTGTDAGITVAQVTIPVTLRTSALGYDPTDANNTAVADLAVIPFPYTWDLTTGDFNTKTKALELINITGDGNGYVLLGPGSVAVHGIAIVAGREKPKTNYEIDPTLPNSRLRIPVMEGMKVSITCYGAEERVTGKGYPLEISNVTDLKGYATATLEIKTASNTQEFIAKNNGYVEIYNRSDVNVYIQRITVSAPYLVFDDGENPKISKTATYQNLVVNKPTHATLTFTDDDTNNAKIATRDTNTGTYTFQSNASGNVTVTAQATGARNLEPCWGQYTLSLVDFYFNPNVINLTHYVSSVSYYTNQFFSFAHLKLGNKDWLNMTTEEKSKITLSVAAPSYYNGNPNPAVGIVRETGDANNPYIMEIRNEGQLIITAVYRESTNTVSTVKTTCTVNITMTSFAGFKFSTPIVPSSQATYCFADNANTVNPLNTNGISVASYRCTYIGKETSQGRNSTNIGQTTELTLTYSGVYHLEALDSENHTIAEFYLTKAYPVNMTTSQSWDFRQGVSSEWGTSWSQPKDPATGNNVAEGTEGAVPYFEYADYLWTRGMPTNRASDYRCVRAVNGDNGFIVKETSGLVVMADAPTCDRSIIDGAHCDGHFSAYTGNRYNYVYPNIGLHKSTLIIPHLPKGAYVAIAWDRTSPGDGNTIVMENLLDLEGHTIDEIKYGGSVRLTGANAGNQQGYYTFRVANDGNVTLTQNDKGTSRIVAIHVYYGDPDTNVNASDDINYNRNAIEEFKGSGMTQKLMAYARANADGTADVGSGLMQLDGILTTEGETTSQWLTNYLNFNAPNGVAEFKMVNQDETLRNMTMDMSQTYFDSGNGKYAVPGLSFNGACWGKAIMSVGVRDDNGYLVAYRQYRFTVGMRPKMTYPKTWDFTRFFDNSTVKIVESPVTVLPATVELNTKNSLITNASYPENTENMSILDTSPTRTWDSGNVLKRSSGIQTYHQYGYNEYSSYYVDDAVLVCNLGDRNTNGFAIEETRGLGFNIAESGNSLQWVMPHENNPDRNVGYAGNAYLQMNGTMTIAGVGDNYSDYYVFLRSDRAPDACSENLKAVNRGDYRGIVSNNNGQYIFKVNSPDNMMLTFNSNTKVYGIGVTNIKKDAVHPVGGTGWATESRDIDIDHTLTGYYTIHTLKAYEVKYDSYDMNTATVYLSEIKETGALTDSENMTFYDHGYVPSGKGIVLKEVPTDETAAYAVPLFVPAITTTHPAAISNDNMMSPNIIRKEMHTGDVSGGNDIFILTNVHWKYTVESTWSKEGDNYIESRDGGWQDYGSPTEADAAGFYRLHIWENNAAANTMAANTAYLLVPSNELPIALWNSTTHSNARKGTIGIRELGVFDHIEPIGADHSVNGNSNAEAWYTLDGKILNGVPTKPGLYIHKGRKVVL